MDKKAQVSIFIVLGILIVGSILAYFFLRDKVNLNDGKVPEEFAHVKNMVDDCLKQTVERGIQYLALRGEYYNIPEEFLLVVSPAPFLSQEMSYFYLDNKTNIPTIKTIESELSLYINKNLGFCVNFSEFEEQGFEISYENASSNVKTDNKEIRINLIYPISLKKGKQSFSLRDFSFKVDSNIRKMIKIINETIQTYVENRGSICITCFEDLTEKNRVEVKIVYYDNVVKYENSDVILFFITDKEYKLNGQNIILMFAVEK